MLCIYSQTECMIQGFHPHVSSSFVEHPLHRATGHVFVKPDLMHAQGYTGMKRLRPWVAIGLLPYNNKHHFIILGAHGSLYVERKESSS